MFPFCLFATVRGKGRRARLASLTRWNITPICLRCDKGTGNKIGGSAKRDGREYAMETKFWTVHTPPPEQNWIAM